MIAITLIIKKVMKMVKTIANIIGHMNVLFSIRGILSETKSDERIYGDIRSLFEIEEIFGLEMLKGKLVGFFKDMPVVSDIEFGYDHVIIFLTKDHPEVLKRLFGKRGEYEKFPFLHVRIIPKFET